MNLNMSLRLECAKNRKTAKPNQTKPQMVWFWGPVSETIAVFGFRSSNRNGSWGP
ncbi:hypothetical protein PENSOL_c027G03911, partial [Penicillium solitum]